MTIKKGAPRRGRGAPTEPYKICRRPFEQKRGHPMHSCAAGGQKINKQCAICVQKLYNIYKRWYNFSVRKLTAVTTALALCLALAPSYVFAAPEAESKSGECVYPVEFVEDLKEHEDFNGLTDYAFYGSCSAFASDMNLFIISPDEVYGDNQLSEPVSAPSRITDIDYDDEGNLYVYAPPQVYRYVPDASSQNKLVEAEYEFSTNTEVDAGGYRYVLNSSSGGLMAYNIDQPDPQYLFEEGCSHLKVYNDTAYIIYDDGVYRLEGLNATEVSTEYVDTRKDNGINTGNAAEALLGDYTIQPVIIRSSTSDGYNTYITEVDLTTIGEVFVTPDITDQSGNTTVPSTKRLLNDSNAIAIAEVGNATIFVMPDEQGFSQSYITLTTAVEAQSYTSVSPDIQQAYAREDVILYSRPYMCGATVVTRDENGVIFKVPAGTIFTVEESFSLSYIDTQYYRVTCTVDGQEISGFVAQSLLTPYTFATENEDEQTTGTDGFTFDNNIQTVIIVLLIVLLVLIAIGYVIFYLTRKGDRNGRRRKDPPDEDLYT